MVLMFTIILIQEFIETALVTSPLLEDEDGGSDYVELQDHIVDIPVSSIRSIKS